MSKKTEREVIGISTGQLSLPDHLLEWGLQALEITLFGVVQEHQEVFMLVEEKRLDIGESHSILHVPPREAARLMYTNSHIAAEEAYVDGNFLETLKALKEQEILTYRLIPLNAKGILGYVLTKI